MEEKEAGDNFYECWRGIYRGKECRIEEVWDERTRDNLIKKHEEEKKGNAENEIEPMGQQEMSDKDLKEELKETRKDKVAGPNGLKVEMFKIIGRGIEGREKLRRGINKALETGEAP